MDIRNHKSEENFNQADLSKEYFLIDIKSVDTHQSALDSS